MGTNNLFLMFHVSTNNRTNSTNSHFPCQRLVLKRLVTLPRHRGTLLKTSATGLSDRYSTVLQVDMMSGKLLTVALYNILTHSLPRNTLALLLVLRAKWPVLPRIHGLCCLVPSVYKVLRCSQMPSMLKDYTVEESYVSWQSTMQAN